MPLSSDALREAIANYGESGGAGRAYALRRVASQGVAGGLSGLTSAQETFLKAAETAPNDSRAAAAYQHPAFDSTATNRAHAALVARLGDGTTAGKEQPLSAAQVAFLGRLPEPEAITYDDAVQVFRIAGGLVADQDKPLVDSIAVPLRAIHDRAAVMAQMSNHTTPPQPLPRSAAPALADAIAAENNQLTPDEAHNRAGDEVAKMHNTRQSQHTATLNQLRQRVTELDATTTRRLATTR